MSDNILSSLSSSPEENAKTISMIRDSVLSANSHSLREYIFVNVFLPVFVGEESLYGVDVQNWVNYFGPFVSVAITNDSGEQLYLDDNKTIPFIIPPFYDNKVINPSNFPKEKSLSTIVSHSQKLSNIHPNQGTFYLNNEYNAIFERLKNSQDGLAHLKVWNMIFTRYGRAPILSEGSALVPTPQETLMIQDYEPL